MPEQHPRQYRTVAAGGRRLGEYQIVFVSDGRGWFEHSDGRREEVASGSVFLLRPGDWHRYAPDRATGWQEFWIGFSGTAVDEIWRTLGLGRSRVVALGPAAQEDLLRSFTRGLRLSVQPTPHEQIELAGILQQMLAQIAGALSAGEIDRQADQRFERAREIMLEHLRTHVETADLAEQVGCSRSTLHRLFSQRAGVSPYRYYLSLKINAAKWELVHTDRSMKEIGREYGFSDQYHFSRVFFAIAGVRPSTWRSDHRVDVRRTERTSHAHTERIRPAPAAAAQPADR